MPEFSNIEIFTIQNAFEVGITESMSHCVYMILDLLLVGILIPIVDLIRIINQRKVLMCIQLSCGMNIPNLSMTLKLSKTP